MWITTGPEPTMDDFDARVKQHAYHVIAFSDLVDLWVIKAPSRLDTVVP